MTFKIGAIALAIFSVVALRVWDVSHQQHKGEAKAVAKIEKATTNVIRKGDAAAARSAPGAPGRLLDPSTRAD